MKQNNMTTIQDIKDALVLKISEITDFTDVLWYVAYKDIGYPSVFIKYRWSENVMVDTIRNLVTHNIELSIIYAYDNDKKAEEVLVWLVQKVMDKLDEDRTLWNLLHSLDIKNVDESLMDDIDKVKVMTFSIDCSLFTNRWYV